MASNKKNRNTNQKPEQTKAPAPAAEKAPAANRAYNAEREKQRKEDRQNLLLLIGVIAVLAVVGIVIWITSGSSDEDKTAAVAATSQIAAADTTAPAEIAEAEEVTEEAEEEEAEEPAEEIEAETDGETQELVATEEETEAEEAVTEETESPAEEAPAEEAAAAEITSTTVLDPGTVYTIDNTMPLYEAASADSNTVMDLQAGWAVAIEEADAAGNGWHRVSVWLEGAPTYGYIQIP